jgi:hypothetical protein
MCVTHVISNQLIESITANLIVANVCDLYNLASMDLAKCQVECPAAPIKNEDAAAIEFRETPPVVRFGSKM